MSLLLQSALRILRCLRATAAVSVVLLQGAVMAAPPMEHGLHQAVSVLAGIQLHAEFRAEHPECKPGLADRWCCHAVCTATLLPLGCQAAATFSRGGDRPETVQIKSGFDPEGLRRPPKSAT